MNVLKRWFQRYSDIAEKAELGIEVK